jgi:hypothetical protein
LDEKGFQALKRAQDLESQRVRRAATLEETIQAMTTLYLDRNDPVARAERARGRVQELRQEAQRDVLARARNAPSISITGTHTAAASSIAGARMKADAPIDRRAKTVATTSTSTNERAAAATAKPSPLPEGKPPSTSNARPHDPKHDARPQSSDVTEQTARSSSHAPTRASSHVQPPPPKRTPIPAAVLHQVRLRDRGQCTYRDTQGARCVRQRWVDTHHIVQVSQGGSHELDNLTTLCSAHHKLLHSAYKECVA